MGEKLRLRSVRLDDAFWERVLLAAEEEGRSASQVVAAAVRAYVDGPAGGSERAQETGGAVIPANAPPVAAVQPWRRPPAGEVPQALEQPWECAHPAAARYRGPGYREHCRACGEWRPAALSRVRA